MANVGIAIAMKRFALFMKRFILIFIKIYVSEIEEWFD